VKVVDETDESKLGKVKKAQNVIEDVLAKVRDIYSHNWNKNKMALGPVLLEECYNEVSLVFLKRLEEKGVTLSFKNLLEPGTKVLADKTSLTHSVLSNLVSNALKFSDMDSEIEVLAKEERGQIIVEVTDKGPGIPQDIIANILADRGEVQSSLGTSGEKGQGFGLSIVKSFVDSYGGQIEFESKQQIIHPDSHGTSIRVILEKAPTQLS
jgi:signal transduction histidine kinase